MGSECKKCLKEQRNQQMEFFKDKSERTRDDEERVTRYVNTGFFSINTSFFVSTQQVTKLNVQYLVIFTDSFQNILDNPFLHGIKDSYKLHLQERITAIADKVKFVEPGDYVNIVDPFPNLNILNLLVGWLGVWGGNTKKLQSSISKAFDQIVPASSHGLSLAIAQISNGLGYNCRQYQKLILKKVWQYSKSESELKVYYLTSSTQKVEAFIEEIMASRASFSSQGSTNQSLMSNQSSVYF